WPHFDLDSATVTVRRTMNRVSGKLRFSTPKADKSRTIPLPAFVVQSLQQHRARQQRERALIGEDWKGAEVDLVFCTTIGTPLEPRNLLRHMKSKLEGLGIPHRRFHDLRHTAASLPLSKVPHFMTSRRSLVTLRSASPPICTDTCS